MKTKTPPSRNHFPRPRLLAEAQREERIWFSKLVQAKDAAEEARQRWVEAAGKVRGMKR